MSGMVWWAESCSLRISFHWWNKGRGPEGSDNGSHPPRRDLNYRQKYTHNDYCMYTCTVPKILHVHVCSILMYNNYLLALLCVYVHCIELTIGKATAMAKEDNSYNYRMKSINNYISVAFKYKHSLYTRVET